MVKNSESKFLEVICVRCGNRQILFGKSTTRVKCSRCNKLLVQPRGGKVRVKTLVKRIYS